MSASGKVFDVEAEATTGADIAPYIRRNDRRVAETVDSQARLKARWYEERDALRANVGMSSDLRSQWQLEQLRALVDHAFSTKPFYRELYTEVGYELGAIRSWSDFESLPTTSKKTMVDAGFSEACAGGVLHSARTSGSNGMNLTIYQDDESVSYRHLRYMRHCELLMGRALSERDLRYGIYFAAERYTSLLGDYRFVTVSQEAPPSVLASHLSSLRPALLLSFPSYLQRLAATGIKLDDLDVLAVGTNSERSSVEERNTLSREFGIPVLDEYSSEEMSLIAYECRERRYHLVEDSGYFELSGVDDQGYGRLVGTSLGNRAMPFIRYEQGDLLRIDPLWVCGCGSTFRTIDSFRGREDELMKDGDTGFVPADAILGLCDETLVERGSNILEYQIVQVARDRVDLRVKLIDPRKGLDNSYVRNFSDRFPLLFRSVNVKVHVEEVKAMETFVSGKRRLVKVESFEDSAS
ncbi:phenylacetate--CoA ligase family protein [Rathayibacter toxicus]|uniref:phenylacetate--CoA ligase family protein n=1 Tax=Rathayibacter toxicus TaxID=145458 RepID=UPI000CE90801|nr:phenylacetate--CoA ligase family protein [Rathayibacter toxicus]PPI55359.1 hypothetical protein C5D35_06600 [Rathayibacter toxicus]QOD11309.1 phenylacetate--CoA ligase family protein [Rathayibacter toxicus]QWL28051.1 phenylacetate--CoA ligase family protein [Rathayibacter toxicus]QWL32250.1 phenylacetate--CoA ligase family protein [Rathayibacter toxicus]QWL34343.1 phenylacetate--CoA ligase family protein [Rathayibacter toxicus]